MERERIYNRAENIRFPFYEAKSGLSILPTMNTMNAANANYKAMDILDSIRLKRDQKRRARNAGLTKHSKKKEPPDSTNQPRFNKDTQHAEEREPVEKCNGVQHQQHKDLKYSH